MRWFILAKEKKSSKKEKKLHHYVKHHLSKEVKLSVGLVVIVLLLVIIRLPYEAKEVYTIKVTEEEAREVFDRNVEVRVCTPVPAAVREEPDPFSPFVKAVMFHHYPHYGMNLKLTIVKKEIQLLDSMK